MNKKANFKLNPRRTIQTFVSHTAWESEAWIAGQPNHMIHFNGERFLAPYATTPMRTAGHYSLSAN